MFDYKKVKSQLPTISIKENWNTANKKKKLELEKQAEKTLPEFFTGRLTFCGSRNPNSQQTFYYENGKRINTICEYCLQSGSGLQGTDTKNGMVWFHEKCV